MKYKILLLTVLLLVFSMCDVKVDVQPRNAVAQNNNNENQNLSTQTRYAFIDVKVVEKDGMRFLIVAHYGLSDSGRDVEVINLTKEKLEIELLKKQIEND